MLNKLRFLKLVKRLAGCAVYHNYTLVFEQFANVIVTDHTDRQTGRQTDIQTYSP